MRSTPQARVSYGSHDVHGVLDPRAGPILHLVPQAQGHLART